MEVGSRLASLIWSRWPIIENLHLLYRFGCFIFQTSLKQASVGLKYKTSNALRWRFSVRSVADSNCCRWFCRPLPSHSAKRPFLFSDCKSKKFCNSYNNILLKRNYLRNFCQFEFTCVLLFTACWVMVVDFGFSPSFNSRERPSWHLSRQPPSFRLSVIKNIA